MERFHYDGEGDLEDPPTENRLLRDYADKKAFTGVAVVGILVVILAVLCGVIYATAYAIMSIIELIIK